MKDPWVKFFFRDWRADMALRACSLSARGLWIEMLGIMHDAEPYGHLLVGSGSPGPDTLAMLVGRPLEEVRSALAELASTSVFSRTDSGVIFSRRMVRDRERALAASEWGRRGGNPNLRDKGGDKGRDKLSRARVQKPEARSQIPETRDQSSNSSQGPNSSGKTPPSSGAEGAPPQPKAKAATGPHADCIRHWETEWARTRKGQVWAWTDKDARFVAQARKMGGGSVEEFRRRATRLLEEKTPWALEMASPATLVGQWNRLGVQVAAGGKNGHEMSFEEECRTNSLEERQRRIDEAEREFERMRAGEQRQREGA